MYEGLIMVVVGVVDLAILFGTGMENYFLLIAGILALITGLPTFLFSIYAKKKLERSQEKWGRQSETVVGPDFSNLSKDEKLSELDKRFMDGEMDENLYYAIKDKIEKG